VRSLLGTEDWDGVLIFECSLRNLFLYDDLCFQLKWPQVHSFLISQKEFQLFERMSFIEYACRLI